MQAILKLGSLLACYSCKNLVDLKYNRKLYGSRSSYSSSRSNYASYSSSDWSMDSYSGSYSSMDDYLYLDSYYYGGSDQSSYANPLNSYNEYWDSSAGKTYGPLTDYYKP